MSSSSLSLLVATVCAVAFSDAKSVTLGAVEVPITTSSFENTECVNGKWHTTSYTTTGLSDIAFVDLDTMNHLEAVTCDLDGTRLKLQFTSDVYAAEYFLKFHDWNDHFIVGGAKWNCTVLQRGTPGLIIRRIVGASESGSSLNVQASEARYDEIYEDADISFASEGSCSEGDVAKDKHVCVGYNTDCTGKATSSLPIYQNSAMDLECSECFVDFTMDIFVEVNIRGWQVANLSTGFRNVAINSSAVIDAKAAKNWNTGIDKTLPLLQNTYLVNFKVGVVPFMIFFDLPVEIKADFQFLSDAEATLGATLNLGIGDAFVSWDPINHWTHSLPSPVFEAAPVFTTSASLNAAASLTIVPTLTAHFDRLLSYQLQATPVLSMTVQGSEASKQVCLQSNFDVSIKSVTTLDINIPWANIAKDWTWNKDVYESGAKPLVNKCLNL
eukprot:m.133247 g.133247  ORF g.133247 m.133247 type:complete len:441 (-) comp29663_c2_seq1:140-1462(-)